MDVNSLGTVRGEQNEDYGLLLGRTLRYLKLALDILQIPHAVSGRAAGFMNGLNKPPEKITVALLDSDPSVYSEVVEQRVANLLFDDNRRLFHLNHPHPLFFKDERLTLTSKDKCEVVFFRVDDLFPSSRVQFSNLVEGKHGGSLSTAPFFLLLDYLMEVARKIHFSILFGDTRISHGTSSTRFPEPTLICSGKATRMVTNLSVMMKHLEPGSLDDRRFVEGKDIEYIQYLAKFVPDIALFAPFQHIFPAASTNVKPEADLEPDVAGLATRASVPHPVNPMSIPLIKRPSTDKSLRWAADAVLNALWHANLPSALIGGMANYLHGASTFPTHIDVLVFPPQGQYLLDKDEVRRMVALHDPVNFLLVEPQNNWTPTMLYYQPATTTLSRMPFGFSIEGKFSHRDRCRIEIVSPSDPPLSDLVPAWTQALVENWPRIGTLSVIPFYLAILCQLNVWHTHHLLGLPDHVQDAEALYQLLHFHLAEHEQMQLPGTPCFPIYQLWNRCPFWTPRLQQITEYKVATFVAHATFGPLSKRKWIMIGWHPPSN